MKNHPSLAAPCRSTRSLTRTVASGAALALVATLHGADCTQTSTGLVAITDLGANLYLGQYQGGLYPNGLNAPPLQHHALAGLSAVQIQPRLPDGTVSLAGGKIVMLSIGMSNTTQEFCSGSGPPCAPHSFTGQALANPNTDHTWLVFVDGAAGGQSAATWDSPADANYERVKTQELATQGLSEAQVQVVWIKVANPSPTLSLPNANADAIVLSKQIASIARAVRVRYPNCKLAFHSSRIYAGYASTLLNPEPYAYESGFAVKWAVGEQISQTAGNPPSNGYGALVAGVDAPVMMWGPYLWADGLTPNGEGDTWACADLSQDGTHPSSSGVTKVGTQLLNFMLGSPYSRVWFRAMKPSDFNGDGVVNGADLSTLLSAWGPCDAPPYCDADLDWNGIVNGSDLGILLSEWAS